MREYRGITSTGRIWGQLQKPKDKAKLIIRSYVFIKIGEKSSFAMEIKTPSNGDVFQRQF